MPQSITTAYQLVFVRIQQNSRNGWSILSDVYLSNFQTNVTKTITGNSNSRTQGGCFFYNKNTKVFGLNVTGTGSTNITFNNGLYYLYSVSNIAQQTRASKMELYGNNGSSSNILLQSYNNEYGYSFNVNTNILINV